MPHSPDSTDLDADPGAGAGGSDREVRSASTPGSSSGWARPIGGLPSGGLRRHRSGRGLEGGGSRSQSRTKKIAQLRLMITALLVVVMGTTMAAIYYWTKVDTLDGEALSLSTDLSHAQKELEKARELLRQQDGEISAMMTRRIPGVAELTFDTLFDLNNKYLRKLTFSQAGVGKDKVIEYHAVLENKTSSPILPDARIILFDRMGLQVGAVKLDKDRSASPATLPELRADETRTYAGTVLTERDAEPKYFLVQVK